MARGIIGGLLRLGLAGGLAAAAATLGAQPASADWFGDEQRLTTDQAVQSWPQLSGAKLVYSDYRNERAVGDPNDPEVLNDIRVRDLRTGEDRSLTPKHTANGRAAISGNRVVWSDHGDGRSTGGIWYRNLATGTHKRLPVKGGSEVEIDRTRVCYERGSRIYVYDFTTNKERAVSPKSASASACDVSGRIVVWQQHDGNDFDIFSYDLDERRTRQLTSDPADQSMPRISGQRVVWEDHRNGLLDYDIYLFDLATGSESRITDAPGVQWFADIDGDRIVWMDERTDDGNTEVYLYDLASRIETRLTNHPGWSGNPVISGDRVVYQDNYRGNDDLYQRMITPPHVTVRVPASVGRDASVPVTGGVIGVKGVPVAAETVRLEYSTDGTTWVAADETTTSLSGTFRLNSPSLARTTWLRVRFPGTPEFPAAVSPESQVVVQVLRLRGVALR